MNDPTNLTSVTLAREPAFHLGGLEIRPSTREVIGAGWREVLEPRVMQVLVALAKAGGAVIARDDLIALCWEGRVVGDDALNRVIGKIRRLAARPDAGLTLETIRKVGYRLAPAAVAAPDAAAQCGTDDAEPPAEALVAAAVAAQPGHRLRWQWMAAAACIAAFSLWVAFAAVLPQQGVQDAIAAAGALRLAAASLDGGAAATLPAPAVADEDWEIEVAETPRGRPVTGAARPMAAESPLQDAGASLGPMSFLPPA